MASRKVNYGKIDTKKVWAISAFVIVLVVFIIIIVVFLSVFLGFYSTKQLVLEQKQTLLQVAPTVFTPLISQDFVAPVFASCNVNIQSTLQNFYWQGIQVGALPVGYTFTNYAYVFKNFAIVHSTITSTQFTTFTEGTQTVVASENYNIIISQSVDINNNYTIIYQMALPDNGYVNLTVEYIPSASYTLNSVAVHTPFIIITRQVVSQKINTSQVFNAFPLFQYNPFCTVP